MWCLFFYFFSANINSFQSQSTSNDFLHDWNHSHDEQLVEIDTSMEVEKNPFKSEWALNFEEMLEIYNTNIGFLNETLNNGDSEILDVDKFDVFVQMKYTCDIFSENLPGNIDEIRSLISGSKEIFILPDEGVFNSEQLKRYNQSIIDFSEWVLSYDQFYTNLDASTQDFLKDVSNEPLKDFVSFYESLYDDLYAQYTWWNTVNCNERIKNSFNLVTQDY